jgi:hypothetical protein
MPKIVKGMTGLGVFSGENVGFGSVNNPKAETVSVPAEISAPAELNLWQKIVSKVRRIYE